MGNIFGRRTALLGAGAMLIGGAEQSRTAQWLTAWDSHDIHRTATPGDTAGADWLTNEARALGATVTIETFPLARYDPLIAFVELEGTRYPGVAMFDAPDTPDGRIHALATMIGSGEGHVALGEYSPLAVYSPEFTRMRRDSKALVLVIVTKGGAPGLALLNAEAFTAPYGPSVLQVPSETGDILLPAVARGAAMRVAIRSTRTRVEARNVVVTLKGRNPSRPPLVVMTPRSSWWVSTAERGGGLVCWLEALRATLATPPACDVVFTANSGHELGHIGLDAFIAHRPGWIERATWVHFGANIGAAGGTLSVVSGTASLRTQTSDALSAAGQPHTPAPSATVPNGETRDIHRAGGRYITFVGSSKLFHLPQDRLPTSVDQPALTRIAATAAHLVTDLAS